MKPYYLLSLRLAAVVCVCFSHSADAAIGKIGGRAIGNVGSPVVPSNAPKTKTEPDGKDEAANGTVENTPRNPLLVITFNKKRINFGRVLGQSIIANEKENGGITYDVVSRVPSSSSNSGNQARLNQIYSRNLNTVLQEMQRIGISSDRIRTNTELKVDNSAQEIAVYGDHQ